ncbi:hypothetical protein CRYUN_Cryun28dG0043600 [Craigia yunnanensis]
MVCLQFGSTGMYIISLITLNHCLNRYVLIVYRNAIAALALAHFALVLERLEQVKAKEVRSQAKVIGTLVTLSGVLLMTFYEGPVIDLIWSRKTIHYGSSGDSSDKHWISRTLIILVGCVAWSCFYVLQSLAIALVVEHHPSGWIVGWNSRLLAPLYTVIVSSGITYYVQVLVLKTRGPVFVTAFNPLCMIIVAALGSAILGEQIHLGSPIGGIIIAIGLYSVVWGKSKDCTAQSTPAKVDHIQELPISEKNCADGSKLVIATINSAQQGGN